jgi:phosphate transport system substrate-binding protein
LKDGAASAVPVPRELGRVMRLLNRMSIVVIRIRNNGSYDIDANDFEEPLSFTFGQRVVWNAHVSEASTEDVRKQLRASLCFFPTESAEAAEAATEAPVVVESSLGRDNLTTVRQRITERMWRWWQGGPPIEQQSAKPDVREPQWHGVRMAGLSLKRGQKAKLVVVLSEPDSGKNELTKTVQLNGRLKEAGLIEDERETRLITLPRASGALAILLTVLLVLGLVFDPGPRDTTVLCSAGDLRIEGSSVFMPTMTTLADEYVKACGHNTRIVKDPNGSIAGVRHVFESDATQSGGLIALSDDQSSDHKNLYSEPIAIVVYHVVVNSSVGITTLSIEDLRKIHNGTYTDWSQITGDRDRLPIRIIGRGQDSGTRQLFERKVLDTGEGELSSNNCLDKERNPQAPIIRCERESNTEIVQKVSTIPGAISYADAPSIAQARRTNVLTALTLDGKAFDTSTAVESGYPFWTVEYLYTKRSPEPGSLTAKFIDFVHTHELARAHLAENGFRPCTTPDGPLDLCTLR